MKRILIVEDSGPQGIEMAQRHAPNLAGCNEFGTKPIDFTGLLKKMEQLLEVAS